MNPAKHFTAKPSASRGFTLVELMVVIVIIAVLATIGFSVANRARKKANSISCLQNLRDWTMVFNLCAADRSGRLPTPANWAAISNTPYDPTSDNPGRAPFTDYWAEDIGTAFRIQLEKRACPCLEEGTTPGGNRAPTYMMNWRLSRAPTYLEMHMSSVPRPARKVFFIDGSVGAPLRMDNKSAMQFINAAAPSHGGTVNAVFADLHVEPIRPKNLEDNWNEMTLP